MAYALPERHSEYQPPRPMPSRAVRWDAPTELQIRVPASSTQPLPLVRRIDDANFGNELELDLAEVPVSKGRLYFARALFVLLFSLAGALLVYELLLLHAGHWIWPWHGPMLEPIHQVPTIVNNAR